MATVKCLVSNILQSIKLWTLLNLKVSKWWQSLWFWVTYPFKFPENVKNKQTKIRGKILNKHSQL